MSDKTPVTLDYAFLADRWISFGEPPPSGAWCAEFTRECVKLTAERKEYVDAVLPHIAKMEALRTLTFPTSALEEDRARVGLMKVKADILKTIVDTGRTASQSQDRPASGATTMVVNFTEARRDGNG